jgi:ketosteroid isomerase-like protein
MKNKLSLLFIIITLASCNQRENIVKENEQIIKQYFNYFNKHQWKEMAEMYVDIAEFKDPSLGQGIVKQTRQQTITKYKSLNDTFPDIHDEIKQIYHSGDEHIIVEFISSGTAPDNSKFELAICTIFKITDGKIVQDFTYYDNSK